MMMNNRNLTKDIMQLETTLEELLCYKERLRIALDASKTCIFEVDLIKQRYTFFENAKYIFGVTDEKILDDVAAFCHLTPVEYQKAVSRYFSHPEDQLVIDHAFESILSGKTASYQARMRAGNSEYKWCKIDVTPVLKNQVPVKMIGVITDISDMVTKTKTLEKKATLDLFTGLYNKNTTVKYINDVLETHAEETHALLLFDLDSFKVINDTYGHAKGDEVLKSVADNLKDIFRKSDICGRFGGDEFIILIKNIPNKEVLTSKLRQLIRNTDNEYLITKSIGVAVFPKDGLLFDELFQKADLALYESKRKKNTYTIFE